MQQDIPQGEKRRSEFSSKPLRLHAHQTDAIKVAQAGHNYVLTTGTGSGKSLAYIIPIVDHVLRRGSGRGMQAIVVYPMNALANSQEGELKNSCVMATQTGKDRSPSRVTPVRRQTSRSNRSSHTLRISC
jgi:ATP-dependent helicase YprA (DUF1998 family)